MIPTIVATRRPAGRPHFKGGVVGYGQVQRDLGLLLRDSDVAIVTTLLDYYALPDDFPGMADRPAAGAAQRVTHVERAWTAAVGDPRFVPHLALHEFEAWIYAEPRGLEPWMFDDDPAIISAIAEVAAQHATPEDIDEGRETSPAKRLARVFPGYQKTIHGPIAVSGIGIDRIRATCPHFHRWLERVEAAAPSPPGPDLADRDR